MVPAVGSTTGLALLVPAETTALELLAAALGASEFPRPMSAVTGAETVEDIAGVTTGVVMETGVTTGASGGVADVGVTVAAGADGAAVAAGSVTVVTAGLAAGAAGVLCDPLVGAGVAV